MLNTVLVAVDGSAQSLEVCRYAAETLAGKQTWLTLYFAGSKMPEVFWDLEIAPEECSSILACNPAFAGRQDQMMEAFMDQALVEFESRGLSQEKIVRLIKPREKGVARDIAAEVKKGFDALIIGRGRSITATSPPLGSVASKLVGILRSLPVLVVGGLPAPGRVLIALDASPGSQRAFEFAASVYPPGRTEIVLLHVTRKLALPPGFDHFLLPREEKNWYEDVRKEFNEARKKMEARLELYHCRLIEKGFASQHVSIVVTTERQSRADAILSEARRLQCDTLVLGRKGLTDVADFGMGRVTHKILQMFAGNLALWIVS